MSEDQPSRTGERRPVVDSEREVRTDPDDFGVDVTSTSVSLSGLEKRFDGTVAVDGIDLDIEPGELLVLLGPSGCGKTTTLRMVAGLESVTSGRVTIDGTDVSRATPQERDVAMVFQNYALYPHKTVRENIAFPLHKLELSDSEVTNRVTSTASLLDVDDLLDKQPAALSGGQRQRVAVGRALARRPAVLLMDEPLSNLDAKLRVNTRSELRDLQQRLGITTIYVTHDQEEAMSIADRIAIMNDGRVTQVGTPQAVYRRPTSEFVASFLGDPSMNIFDIDDASPVVARLNAAVPATTVRVGIRPEDAYLVSADGPVGAPDGELTDPVSCSVTVVEPIGRAYEVTLSAGGRQFVVRTRERPSWLQVDESVAVAFDTAAIAFFGPDGRRLSDG